MLPFTSEDIDFKGNRDDVRHIAEQLKLTPVYPHPVEMTTLAGAIPFRIGNLNSNIEVVRTIPGVAAGMVDALAVRAEWSGKQIRVLDPVSLLLCKLELALKLPQEKRQDAVHLKILVVCARGFIRELLREVERGGIPAKGWLGAVKRLLKMAVSSPGRKAAKRFRINWNEILPMPEIVRCRHEKFARFYEMQLSHEK